MKRALVTATLLCFATSSSALAKPTTTVFPLTAPNLPMKIAAAPEQLSKALADELEGDVAKLPIDDAAGLVGCDPEATSCLTMVSKNYKSKRIVFGTITMIDDSRLKITLTRFDVGPDRQQRAFTVEGDVEEMAEELVKLSRPLFDGTEAVEPPIEDKPPIEDPPPEKLPGPKGEVSGFSIGVLVVGGVALATGVGFLYSANQIAQEVQAARPKTEDDFNKLIPLENKGEQRQLIGTVLTGVGIVGVGYGIIRVLMERSAGGSSSSTESSMGRRLSPVPIEGGAALVFSMELP